MPTVYIEPTWQPMLDFGTQRSTVTWSTFRALQGPVSFRLTDVSAYDNRRWYRADMNMWLLDSNDRIYGSGSMTKWWGQNASCSLGTFQPGRTLKLRTQVRIMETSAGYGSIGSGTWSGYLSWNPQMS